MRKLYFCPFVVINLMLASGALLAQVNTSTKVLSFVGATGFNPGKPADVPINQLVQGPDVEAARQFCGNLPERHFPSGSCGKFDGEGFTEIVMESLQGLNKEEIQWETKKWRREKTVLPIYGGHLTAAHDAMFGILGLGEGLHPELDAIFISSPDKAGPPLPPVEEVNSKLLSQFATLSADEWLQRHYAMSEEDYAKDPARSRLTVLLSRANHMSYHLGQITLALK